MFAINSEITIRPNETPKAYRIRLYKNKDVYGLTNYEIGQLCNGAYGVNYDESAHRKHVTPYLEGYNDAKAELCSADTQLQGLIEENRHTAIEARKERYKLAAEKIEYNRWLRENARDELITEKICDSIRELSPIEPPPYLRPNRSDRSYLLCLADAHYGIEFEIRDFFGNILNKYSPEIFEDRMWYLLNRLIDFIAHENVEELTIFELGDGIDGLLRLDSHLMKLRYGVLDSTMRYAEFMSVWLNELSKYVRIKFHMVLDSNHCQLRMVSAPKNSFKDENMSKVMLAFLKERLKDNENIVFVENPTGINFAFMSTYAVVGFHGEYKNFSHSLDAIQRTYQTHIDYCIQGHIHHKKGEEIGVDSEILAVRSIIGVDPYGESLLKTSDAGVSLFTFEQGQGKTAEHTFKLN